MEKVLSNAEMRAADSYTIEKLGICAGQLMENAGKAIADEVLKAAKKLDTTDILIVCGTGNNGGDGYVCAKELLKRGLKVKIYAFDGTLSPDCANAKTAFESQAKSLNIACESIYSGDICGSIIVDCIFGTGLNRNVSGEYEKVIQKINSSRAFVISADIPSGLCGDNGKVLGVAVKADLTVAIAEYKAGTFLNDGLDYCGKTVKKDIGIVCPQESYAQIYSEKDIAKFYPARPHNSHKGTFGSANLIAGSAQYAGAAALALSAALKSGCGFVKLTCADEVKALILSKFPQAIYLDKPDLTSSAIAAGMGCGVTEELYKTLKFLLENYKGTLIIDADGLNVLSKFGKEILKGKTCNVILTPHVKEFSRLTGLTVEQITSSPMESARAFASEFKVTLLLKGAASVITDGNKTAVNVRGSSALAKAGSGDMLSGYLCGSAARGLNAFDACVCAAFTLGLSAEITAKQKTDYCTAAEDILKKIHFAVRRLTTQNPSVRI